nr:hypothetical protein [Streptomyces sp. CB02120-2]
MAVVVQKADKQVEAGLLGGVDEAGEDREVGNESGDGGPLLPQVADVVGGVAAGL